jgi:CheY-like chemotaxis protein
MSPRHVLVVDDDQAILDCLRDALELEGYAVSTARHGQEAMELLANGAPDVIVLDLWMPVMDGWQFAEAYSRTPGPHGPVILISASRDVVTAAKQIGAAAYLPKPFAVEALLGLIASTLIASPSA